MTELDLDLPVVRVAPYKRLFYTIFVVNIILAVLTYGLIYSGVMQLPGLASAKNINYAMILSMVALTILHTAYSNKLLNKLRKIESFELRLASYQRLYNFRMKWFLFAAIANLVFGALSGRMLFFYFSAIDLLLMLPYIPSRLMFRKELENSDLNIV